jgi:abortive infection bacteriophage resistance protein
MDLKKPLTFSEQIDRLKQHGVSFNDENTAAEILSIINYYRFSGYLLQYRKSITDSDLKVKVSFLSIYDIYKFDEELRALLRIFIEKVEIYFRTQISYYFSSVKCILPPHDQHYDRNNYFDKVGFDEVINSFKQQKKFYKDSPILKHHQIVYQNKMPLWVIVEFLSFSNLSKLYNSMYYSEKDIIATSSGTGHKTLENHLHCLTVLRNKCAHSARLFNSNFNPPAIFSKKFLRNNPLIKNDSLFAYILVLLKRLPLKEDKKEFVSKIEFLLNKYKSNVDLSLIGFPNNYLFLLNQELS